MENSINNEEQILWRAFKEGDKDAFRKIYERYIDALFTYGYYFSKDKDLVADAIHELFIDLWRMKTNLSDVTAIKYYLFRALQRKIWHLVDTENVFNKMPDKMIEPTEIDVEEQIILDEQAHEYQLLLSQGLSLLPQRQLQAVHLRFFDNLNTHEIADIMGMNEQSVRNIIQRALQKLRMGFHTVLFFVFFL